MTPSPPLLTLSELLQELPASDPTSFSRKLARVERLGFRDPSEINLFCKIWSEYCTSLSLGQRDPAFLHPLASIFQFETEFSPQAGVDGKSFLIREGLPPLRKLLQEKTYERHPEIADEWLFLVKILVFLDSPSNAGRIVADLIQSGFAAESFVWGVIFDIASETPSWSQFFWENSFEYLPDLFCGVCLLDFSNHLAREQAKRPHPFSNPIGIDRLKEWLSSDDPGDETYAMSATDAIPFLEDHQREELLELALTHPSEEVRLIAVETLLKSDPQRGIELLKELCLNPVTSRRAESRLLEVGQAETIPPEIKQEGFQAIAEFCDWLRDPENFGEIADEIDCIAHTRQYWPPTGDERTFYLFKYVFFSDCQEDDRPDEVGVGVVGSRTISLVGLTNPTMSPREILAMHCCWELQQLGDPRAPATISIDEGEKLLRERPEN